MRTLDKTALYQTLTNMSIFELQKLKQRFKMMYNINLKAKNGRSLFSELNKLGFIMFREKKSPKMGKH